MFWCNHCSDCVCGGTYVPKMRFYLIFDTTFHQFKMIKWFIIEKMNHRRRFARNHHRTMINFQPNLDSCFFEFWLHAPLLNCSNRPNDYAYWWFNYFSCFSLFSSSVYCCAHSRSCCLYWFAISVRISEIMTIDKCFDVSFYTAFGFDWLNIRSFFRMWQYHSKWVHIQNHLPLQWNTLHWFVYAFFFCFWGEILICLCLDFMNSEIMPKSHAIYSM